MRKTTISIAMATFNGANYLQAQLDSFSSQTLLPDELVVCDDGSHDNTISILEVFRREAPFDVQIFRNAGNLGYIKNFEKAISLCRGDILFLSDQDDLWLPEKIQRVLRVFEQSPTTMVVLNDQIIADQDLTPSATTKLSNMRRSGVSNKHFVTGCCSAHRREWRSLVLPIPDRATAHDSWINGLAHSLGVAAVLDVPLQLYRRHDHNVSNSIFSLQVKTSAVRRLSALRLPRLEDGWRRTLELHAIVRERLRDRLFVLQELDLVENACNLLRRLEESQGSYERRIQFCQASGLRRLVALFRVWRSGGLRRLGSH